MHPDDIAYYTRREAAERLAIAASPSARIANIHTKLARAYAERLRVAEAALAATPVEP